MVLKMHLIKSTFILAAVCCILQSHVLRADENGTDTTTTEKTKTTSTSERSTTSTTTQRSTTSERTSTTAKPSSSSTKAPEPNPTPELKFPENIGSWNISDLDKNVTCIVLKSAIQLNLNFTDKSNKTQTGQVDIPVNATATGECSPSGKPDEQVLTLTWPVEVDKKIQNNHVTFTFIVNKTESTNSTKESGKYAVKEISVMIYKDEKTFPNATGDLKDPFTMSLNGEPRLSTPLNNSYSCKADIELFARDAKLSVKMENAQVEAFRKSPANNTEFSKESVCDEDISDVIPIAVGAIVAIVFIVLISIGLGALVVFFIKKRRAQGGAGYQNM